MSNYSLLAIVDAINSVTAPPEETSGVWDEAVAVETGQPLAYDWTLGSFKSDAKWANQMASRDWTLDQIDDMLQNGKEFDLINNVHPQNTAKLYLDNSTNRYVVVDDVTNEILQISGKNFKLPKILK